MYRNGPIFALDLATHCGIAVGRPSEHPRSEVRRLKKPGEHRSVGLYALQVMIDEWWSAERPALVAIEAPLPLGGFASRGNSQAVVRSTYGMLAIVEAASIRFDVPVHEVAPSTARKHFIGKGKLGERAETKRAVIQRCHQLGYMPKDCRDDNRADALCVWDWACAHLLRSPPRELHMFGEGTAA